MASPLLFKGDYKDPGLDQELARALDSILAGCQSRVAILCIGTDANISDSLGPLTGAMLVEAGSLLPVYGTLEDPIHARNIMTRVEMIKRNHPGFLELAIDASAGRREELGAVEIKNSGVFPGKALHKRLPQVGHISILGKVGVLQGLRSPGHVTEGRLGMVYHMAQVIARGILRWEREPGLK